MNRHMPDTPDTPDHHHDDLGSLDALLREWHEENAERARAQRDQLLAVVGPTLAAQRARAQSTQHADPFSWAALRRKLMTRYMPIAATLALVVTLATLLVPMSAQPAFADGGMIMVPEGGKLEALDERGNLIGPCALKHTHVDVAVSGFLARVTLTQEYHNPYDQKIEAVYTFPMSHRGAVDGFKMIVGERIVEGEVKEREAARQIYEQARDAGYVASLLEQERPNIFTQSVANIEPEATVKIEISYIEFVEEKDGEYEFAFPMVVGPRYIPGRPTVTHSLIPAELTARRGVILLGPAQLTVGAGGETATLGTLQPGRLAALIESAQAIDYPGETWWGRGDATGGAAQPALWHRFEAAYCDGAKEFGELFTDGTGWINGRWFYFDPRNIENMGTGFSQDTNQVPDASRITPMPVKPPTRAGHDISLTMTIDTGGPGIVALDSKLHEINGNDFVHKLGLPPSKVTVELANAREIPNRDFVINWKQSSDAITEAVFTHTGAYGDYAGGFFTLILQPPDRVPDSPVQPRELVFVMDTSGSMNGMPIEKSKEVITRAIESMRPDDTFNIITFAGNTSILWPEPRPATEDNRKLAQQFVGSRRGGGGTEMMKAIHAALVQQEAPALRAGRNEPVESSDDLDHTRDSEGRDTAPMRLVLFLTDGYVGNEAEIIKAVRDNAATTRVFSFGIGNSINRHLLGGMAEAGRGEVEYVLLASNADEAVERFTKRIETPVLTDITLTFSDGLEVTDVLPKGGLVPDLFDAKPLVIQGRYAVPENRETRKGELTIRGNTGAGPYERTLDIEFPADQPEHRATATLWARSMVDEFAGNENDQGSIAQVVKLGESFQIMTQHTSFVAVEKSRITIEGKPVLVAIPVELPDGTRWEGFFGGDRDDAEQLGKEVVMLGTELRFAGAELITPANPMGPAEAAMHEREGAERVARQQHVESLLLRVRELQSQQKYNEALQVVDQILFLDEGNAAAKALRDFIRSSDTYREYAANTRRENTGVAMQAMGRPDANLGVRGMQSTTGLMEYPEGWPSSSLGLTIEGAQTSAGQSNIYYTRSNESGQATAGYPVVAGQASSKLSRGIMPDQAPSSRPAPAEPASPNFAGAPRHDLDESIRKGQGAAGNEGPGGAFARSAGTGGGGGGFGGGGGGGGGGGTIFDDPSEPRDEFSEGPIELTVEEMRGQAESVVKEMIYSELWDDYGGDTLRFDWVNDKPVVVPLQRSPDALAAAIIAQAFVDHYLPFLRPDLELEKPALPNYTDFVDTPENIALLRKLSEKRISVSMKDAPLESVLQAIAALGEVPIAVDWEALQQDMATSAAAVVSLEVDDVTISEALAKLIDNHAPDELAERPVATATQGVVLVSTRDAVARRSVVHVHDVRDLVETGVNGTNLSRAELADQIVWIIVECIHMEGWNLLGGEHYRLYETDDVLFISASIDVHRRVQALLATMRESLQSNSVSTAWRVPDTKCNSVEGDPIVFYNVSAVNPDDIAANDPREVQIIEEWKRSLTDDESLSWGQENINAYQIGQVVMHRIDPDSWGDAGGDEASIESFHGILAVLAPQDTQDQVAAMIGAREFDQPAVNFGVDNSAQSAWAEHAIQRMNRLSRVLDPALLPLAVAPEVPEEPVGVRVSVGGGLRLTVLIESIDPPVIQAIESLGATVEGSSSAGPLVVASVPQSALWKLAMMDVVRRVEPLRAKPAN
jgi:CheY-like chemotaxis protein